tara:strand:+ start:768 stop:926 length:159 start_codon:yes stop_codon:yes gene_type:complete
MKASRYVYGAIDKDETMHITATLWALIIIVGLFAAVAGLVWLGLTLAFWAGS